MRITASSPRRDDDTTTALPAAALALAALISTLVSAPVAAQGAVPCTAIENDRERLACYD